MNTKKSSVKRNLAYQTVYQVLNTFVPLITSPYLARVLGATQQGVFSYTQSIANYFAIIALLGISNYGTRTIATYSEDIKKRSVEFWNMYLFQVAVSIAAIGLYGGYLRFLCKKNRLIAIIQGFYIVGSLLDISWLFFGLEQFETTVTRSIVIRTISVVLIFVFVKKPSDLWIYTLIMSGSVVCGNAILFKFLHQIIDINELKNISLKGIGKHIKPNLVLFIPLLAMSLYRIMDKTMLGILSTFEQSGFYYNVDKIVNIPLSIINGIGVVMLPRMTSLSLDNNSVISDKIFAQSLELVSALAIAMSCGIASISNEFVPLFFGRGFEECVSLCIAMAPVMILKAFSQTTRMQFLIPRHKEGIYLQSVLGGMITNVIANLILIAKLGALGAVLGTIIAEFVTCSWQLFKIRNLISLYEILTKSFVYLLFGLVMFICVRFCGALNRSDMISIIFEVIVGVTIYSILCIVWWKISKNPLRELILKR